MLLKWQSGLHRNLGYQKRTIPSYQPTINKVIIAGQTLESEITIKQSPFDKIGLCSHLFEEECDEFAMQVLTVTTTFPKKCGYELSLLCMLPFEF